jgi:hypothetical protein
MLVELAVIEIVGRLVPLATVIVVDEDALVPDDPVAFAV